MPRSRTAARWVAFAAALIALVPVFTNDTNQIQLHAAWAADVAAADETSIPVVTRADVDAWMELLSNWNRWGADDQLGTLNLITPAKRRAAAALVRDGVSISLAHPADTEPGPDNGSPYVHIMHSNGVEGDGPWCGDEFHIEYHGYAHTHLDALCHMFIDGKLYNGYPKESVGPNGATQLGVHHMQNGIFTRAVLVDVPVVRGEEFLEPGTAIVPSDLEAWERETGLRIGSGDAVFIRTGRWAYRAKHGAWRVGRSSAGLHASCVPWLRQRNIALLGSDAASDVLPSRVDGVSHPVHQLAIVAMGMPILDNCDLEVLSREAQARGRWEFLLTTAPLPVQGATGSPVNPIATF